jgi:hypothetical protein
VVSASTHATSGWASAQATTAFSASVAYPRPRAPGASPYPTVTAPPWFGGPWKPMSPITTWSLDRTSWYTPYAPGLDPLSIARTNASTAINVPCIGYPAIHGRSGSDFPCSSARASPASSWRRHSRALWIRLPIRPL